MREILILGGGASGLAAAIGAAQTGGGGVRVTLVEQNPAPGKKLLATGNGRCNYDNLASGEAERYFTASPAALRALLESIGRQDLPGWWRDLGLVGRADEAGRLCDVMIISSRCGPTTGKRIARSRSPLTTSAFA